jgi:hypothetical protein
MLNIGIGRKNYREIKFYINSKRSLAFVLLSKPLKLNNRTKVEYASAMGHILYVWLKGA